MDRKKKKQLLSSGKSGLELLTMSDEEKMLLNIEAILLHYTNGTICDIIFPANELNLVKPC